ncbi:hypothetical protein C3L33_06173, partial [Rhododendron williamsianum]
MEVKILETTVVLPSPPPPFLVDHHLPLSHLDNDRNLHVTFRYLRAYVATNHHLTTAADPFQVVTAALSAALHHYYPFAGTLRRREDNRLELHCQAGKGVPVIRASVDCTLESVNYLDDPAETWIENLVPDPDPEKGLANPMVLQVTGFACGGYCLGAMVHHAMCDGLGATQFFNGVAELARGASRLSVEPVWDRARLLGPREPPRVEFPVHEFLRLDEGFSPYSASGEPVVRECFHVKEEWLDRLKGFLRERSGYWGNGCVAMYAQTTAKDLVHQPIWSTAELIKKSKRNSTDQYVHSFIDFQELHFAEGITAGKGVSGFTDWRHLGHSTVDFGWGGPVTVLPLSRHLLGRSSLASSYHILRQKGGARMGSKYLCI